MYSCKHICMHTYICIYIARRMQWGVRADYINTSIHICQCIHICVCIYIYIYISVYIHIYECVYIYIHMFV